MKKYMVVLNYCRDMVDIELKYVECDSIEECSKTVRKFIDKYEVMSSEWIGGQVYENHKTYIGTIAYNGKIIK